MYGTKTIYQAYDDLERRAKDIGMEETAHRLHERKSSLSAEQAMMPEYKIPELSIERQMI